MAGLLKFLLRLTGRAGTALPGKAALRLQPRLLSYLTAGRRVFLVTGTNGKTTTVRILCTLLAEQGFGVITNPSGANLDSGLTTTLIDNRRLLRSDNRHETVLVFEIDEAFFAKLAGLLQPSVCVVTNFFRDQLDRYGELQHTRDLISRGLDQTSAQIVLCADDSLCASLARGRESVSRYFGMDAAAMKPGSGNSVLESGFCTFCGSRYSYDAMAYGHLGLFQCNECGFTRPRPELMFSIDAEGSADPQSQLLNLTWQPGNSDPERAAARLAVPGIHNAYNAAGAVLAAIACGSRFRDLAGSLAKASAAFGRMERFSVDDKDVCLILVKNPVGMDRALDYVSGAGDAGAHMLLLNANDPDGRDVSWIWDVDFESRLPAGRIGVSGVRRQDMALRLIYAGKAKQDLLIMEDAMRLFDQCLADCPAGKCLYILPNYTCMLDLRAGLVKRYGLRDFWM
jgi:UDP-N-acetylmuramyl tripeptide synthase